MTHTLLDQFLRNECTAQVRQLLGDAIASTTDPAPRFELNRFEVTIYRDAGLVVLEEVLDASDGGVQRVELAAFTAALRRCST